MYLFFLFLYKFNPLKLLTGKDFKRNNFPPLKKNSKQSLNESFIS